MTKGDEALLREKKKKKRGLQTLILFHARKVYTTEPFMFNRY